MDRRPFASVAEMDAAMIARWNERVTEADEVWHLGDFAVGRRVDRAALLAGLRGRKHLIVGNNDAAETVAEPGWASVQAYAELRVDGVGLVLCHYAFRTWRDMGRGVRNLHGHSHGRLTPLRHQHDVGVDICDFRPVTVGEIVSQPRRVTTAFKAR